jgi:hypothetical protein
MEGELLRAHHANAIRRRRSSALHYIVDARLLVKGPTNPTETVSRASR